jgi:hypothetical protein
MVLVSLYGGSDLSSMLHIISVIPMNVNDVNLSVSFIGVSGLSS